MSLNVVCAKINCMPSLITNDEILRKQEKINKIKEKFERLILSKIGNSLIFELKAKREQNLD